MPHSRRSLLKAAGTSLVAVGAVGAVGSAGATPTDPADDWVPADPSNYTNGSRTASDMRWLVIHTIEGSAGSAINWFQNPDADVSSHYVVGDQPGSITKMVRLEDIAWTQGNWEYNKTGISVEMEGYANETNFGDVMYQQVADIARYVCDAFDIPKRHPTFDIAPCSAYDGEGGIIGHNQIPSPYDCSQVTSGKVDPGDTWDWNYFMDLVTGDTGGGDGGDATFAEGDIVHNTSDLNTRRRPGNEHEVVATLEAESVAEVVNGPVQTDGYTWWGLHWLDRDIWGWSAEPWLAAGRPQRFQDGDPVQTTADVWVRRRPGLDSEAIEIQEAWSDGEIVNGPVDEDGYTWWGVHFYADDLWAWCPGEWLAAR